MLRTVMWSSSPAVPEVAERRMPAVPEIMRAKPSPVPERPGPAGDSVTLLLHISLHFETDLQFDITGNAARVRYLVTLFFSLGAYCVHFV
jgi:hypothetical protein